MDAILITGGAGFIGSNFVRKFMARYPKTDVHVLDALTYAGNLQNFDPDIRDNPRFNFWYGNVCNPGIVGDIMEQVDTVVHFAAESHVARSIYDNGVFFQTDVLGTQVVSNQVVRHRKRIKRFIHISTSEVYGTAYAEPMDEEHPLNPLTPYASAKCGADRLVYSYIQTYDIPAMIVRPFNQYGPYQHLEKCVPRFITNNIEGIPITIHGDGFAARDWVYVDDTCEALLAALQVPLDAIFGEVINIGTGIAYDINTMAEKIVKIQGNIGNHVEHIEDRPGQVDLHISSTDKAKRILNWSARTDIDTGLAETIDWYARNEEWWRPSNWMKTVPLTLAGGQKVFH
ncbi:MAG: dTDP-glucose 4,6-dehydratase [Planctomycetota bacterium]|jgi:dTDP-glucose 4,6-dehydratase